MDRIAICPGSFDPVTYGHIDIITRAAKMFDHVIVAVLINVSKKAPSFTIEERIELLKQALQGVENVEIVGFDGLLADYVKERNAVAIVKGLRAVSDFEYEFQMALANKILNSEAETVFITANSHYMYLSSSIVKQIASLGGDISQFVPDCILETVKTRLLQKRN